MTFKSSEIKTIEYPCNGKSLTFIKPLVMAIVNLTPDSFYDGGKYGTVDDVLRDAEEKIKQGADIVDIGAASSRPNAPEITEVEEWQRLEKVLIAVRGAFPNVFISVDTYRSSIAERSADLGADMINDISGGHFDQHMLTSIARLNLPYIIMHMEGDPRTMANNKPYTNVLDSVTSYFISQIQKLSALNFEKVIIDPGFGFGKSVENNFELLKGLPHFQHLGVPVLAGISRKSMINKVIGTNPVTALNGTTVLNTMALLNGASILRVHDVKEAKEAIDLVQFYKKV